MSEPDVVEVAPAAVQVAPEQIRHGPPTFDGIRELDSNPPRVWTLIYVVSALAAVWLLVFYPAIPWFGGATRGWYGWGTRASLTEAVAKSEANRPDIQIRFEQASLEQAEADPDLRAYAVAAGHAAFGQNCAACHGSAGKGATGFPSLADRDWLWGGTREAIQQTIVHGIRWPGSDAARNTQMPAFGAQGILQRAEILDLTEYVRSLSGAPHDAVAAARAAGPFAENCAACHGPAGLGNQELGAPNLADQVWLYGGSTEAIYHSIWSARGGVMPAFEQRLPEDTIRKLVIYVRAFGGGE